jgi:hypothetical protein
VSDQEAPDGAGAPGDPRAPDGHRSFPPSPDDETSLVAPVPSDDQDYGPRPGYGQPGYAASRGYSTSPPGRNWLPLVVVGLLVAAVLAVAVVVLVTRGGGGKPGAGDPVSSVRVFLSAIKNKDCGKARSFLTGDAEQQAQGSCTAGQIERTRFSDPVLVHRSGTQASVSVKATTGGQSVPITLGLRKVKGTWLISDLNAD